MPIVAVCLSLVLPTAAVAASDAVNRAWTENLFRTLLQRSGSPTDINSYAESLDSGTPPASIARTFVQSAEFRTIVLRQYSMRFLHRAPDATALALVHSGIPISQIAQALLASNEYFALKGGGKTAFLKGLYPDILGRTMQNRELGVFVDFLQGDVNRPIVIGRIWNSSEGARVRVNGWYQMCLGSGPDSRANHFAAMLQSGRTDEDVIVALVSAPQTFTVLPTPTPSPHSPVLVGKTITGSNLNIAVYTLTGSNAAFVLQHVPGTMKVGSPERVTLAFMNTGLLEWRPGHEALACVPVTKCPWTPKNEPLPKAVPPRGEYTFEFTILAPSAPGQYVFEWQLMHDGSLFGSPSTPLLITVTAR